MNTQNPKSKDKHPSLSVSEYLWLQHEKKRLAQMDMDIVRMQYRQDRQSAWIALLILTVIVLAIGLVFTLIF
ncbi:hypothetical protein ACGTJS_11915 [Faucicola mancuniensis]|uniref:hypothetical protein n=1 Tax=Faucicola mancuniensis TaxID=1309795 RepID=UPI0039772533